MGKFSFWQKWLLIVSLIICVFGIMMAFFGGTVLFEPLNSQINPVFWSSNNLDNAAKDFQQWIYGVLGPTMAGWGILMAFIVHYPFKRKEKWSWNCLATALLVWFFADTGMSLYFKVYFNAVFNTVLFAAVILPLIFTRRHFTSVSDRENL